METLKVNEKMKIGTLFRGDSFKNFREGISFDSKEGSIVFISGGYFTPQLSQAMSYALTYSKKSKSRGIITVIENSEKYLNYKDYQNFNIPLEECSRLNAMPLSELKIFEVSGDLEKMLSFYQNYHISLKGLIQKEGGLKHFLEQERTTCEMFRNEYKKLRVW